MPAARMELWTWSGASLSFTGPKWMALHMMQHGSLQPFKPVVMRASHPSSAHISLRRFTRSDPELISAIRAHSHALGNVDYFGSTAFMKATRLSGSVHPFHISGN
jgi:hypothetical protein